MTDEQKIAELMRTYRLTEDEARAALRLITELERTLAASRLRREAIEARLHS